MRSLLLTILLGVLAALPALDVDLSNPLSYGGNQDEGYAVVYNEGHLVSIIGNAWKAFEIPAYELTEESILSFSVDVERDGEIIGIGLVSSIGPINPSRTFQISGTQSWGIQDFRGQSGRIDIPVGQYLSGTVTYVVLVGDDDRSTPVQQTRWSSIDLVERTPTLPVLRLKVEDTPLLQEHAAGGLAITERSMIASIQNETVRALDLNSGYTLDVARGDSIADDIARLQLYIDQGRPGFFWTPVSTVGRDALLGLAGALQAAEDAGLTTYDGAAAAGTLQSALRTMDAIYAASNDG